MEICREEIGPDVERVDPIHVQRRLNSSAAACAAGGHWRSDRVAIPDEDEEEIGVKSWIYFARQGDGGPIKIGRAGDPRKRVMGLAAGSPVPLVLLGALLSDRAEAEEIEIHDRLRSHCIRGEWFVADEALREMERLNLRMCSPEELRRQETPNDSLNAGVNFRAPSAEFAAWKQAARDAGMTFSQWARRQLDLAALAILGDET